MSSAPKGERRENDAYYTPDDLARALVGVLPIADFSTLLEMHVGGGAFIRALRCIMVETYRIGNDIDPNTPGLALCDESLVGDATDIVAPERWDLDWVIGNPPYKGFEAHVDHALTLAPNVAFLLRLAATESSKRVECWKRWPLRKLWVLAERPSFTSDGRTDSAAYGWFWFQRGYTGPAEVVPGWSWK